MLFTPNVLSQSVRNYKNEAEIRGGNRSLARDEARKVDPFAEVDPFGKSFGKSNPPITETLEVSKVGNDKSKLIKAFNLIKENHKSRAVRKFKVVQRLDSRRFLISVSDGINGLLITLTDKGVVDGEQIEVNGVEKTNEIYEYTTVLNAKATVGVFKELGVVVDLTQDEFIKRLKNGEVWMIWRFEKNNCTYCGGDGVAGTPANEKPCKDCDGKGFRSRDLLVRWGSSNTVAIKKETPLPEVERKTSDSSPQPKLVSGDRGTPPYAKNEELAPQVTSDNRAPSNTVESDDFALIPEGDFMRGDSKDGLKDAVPRNVHVGKYFIAKHEVTKALWDEVRAWGGNNGYAELPRGLAKADDHPVTSINWFAAIKWCNARSEKDGLTPCYTVNSETYRVGEQVPECNWQANGYRLPTEAEWEKAARGKLERTRFSWGDTISHIEANFSNKGGESYQRGTTGGHPKYSNSSAPHTAPVGSFSSNQYGLYDVSGNVWEWCWDKLDASYYDTSTTDNPRGSHSGNLQVIRGGGWNSGADYCRVALRGSSNPKYSDHSFGFRLARGADR